MYHRQFCIGGRSRLPFPVNIECRTSTEAENLLRLLQPVVDRCLGLSLSEVMDLICDDDQWMSVCAFMDQTFDIFWVVSLGKRTGVFTT